MGIVEGIVILLVIAIGYFVFTDKSKRSRPSNNSNASENQAKDIAKMRQMAEWDRFDKKD